jgi:hypothetical protein
MVVPRRDANLTRDWLPGAGHAADAHGGPWDR